MSIVAVVFILVAAGIALIVLFHPQITELMSQMTEERRAQQLGEVQRLVEARLRLLTFATMQQMQTVARQHLQENQEQ